MKPFPWRRGMTAIDERGELWLVESDTKNWAQCRPDPNDGATRGALLDAVREVWKDPDAYAYHDDDEWCVPIAHNGTFNANDWLLFAGPSEFAALLAAWEAAP